MIKARTDGLYLMILGTAVFLLLGFALENAAPVSTADFRLMYYSARCLLDHHDPYNPSELERTYQTEGGESPHDTAKIRTTETQYIYPPTAFSITIPFAILPFWAAQILWLLATAGSLILGAFLMWEVSAQYAPLLSGALIGLTLANCELFLAIAGPGGIAIGLCIAAAWCFVRERFVLLGGFRPGDQSDVETSRFRVGLALFLFGWRDISKTGRPDASCNCCVEFAGSRMDFVCCPPLGTRIPDQSGGQFRARRTQRPWLRFCCWHGIAMIISLQTVFSFFRDDPRILQFCELCCLRCAPAGWAIGTLRSRSSLKTAWFAIAPIAALSMLPVYHRLDDAKLLLLTVPACAMLWVRGGPIGRIAALLNVVQILLTSGIPWAIFFALIKHLHSPETAFGYRLLMAVQVFPAPSVLLVVSVFYLCVYVRNLRQNETNSDGKDPSVPETVS